MSVLARMKSRYNALFYVIIFIGLIFSLLGGSAGYQSTYESGIVGKVKTFMAFLLPVTVSVLFARAAIGVREYIFYGDRVIQKGITDTREVAYNDVALAVQVTSIFGKSFELMQEDGKSLTLGGVSDPNRAEELLRAALPSKADVLEGRKIEGDDNATRDTRPKDNALERILAEYAANFQYDPGAPMLIDGDTFEAMTGVSAALADMDRLTEVYVESASDLDPEDLNAERRKGGGARARARRIYKRRRNRSCGSGSSTTENRTNGRRNVFGRPTQRSIA